MKFAERSANPNTITDTDKEEKKVLFSAVT